MDKHPRAAAWLKSGQASPIPSEISRAFDEYVNTRPWYGTTGLDWSRMPLSKVLNIAGVSPAEVYEWAKTTRLGSHDHLAVWYSRDDGGIVVPTREGILAIDDLYRHAPGTRFSFGVDVEDGSIRPFFADLLQYGHGDLLVATA